MTRAAASIHPETAVNRSYLKRGVYTTYLFLGAPGYHWGVAKR